MTGTAKGRQSPQEVTRFNSVGFAIKDFAALRSVRSKLAKANRFTHLDMIAGPDGPRDLYGMLQRAK